MNRREFLGSAGVVALSGCLKFERKYPDNSTETETGTPTPEPTWEDKFDCFGDCEYIEDVIYENFIDVFSPHVAVKLIFTERISGVATARHMSNSSEKVVEVTEEFRKAESVVVKHEGNYLLGDWDHEIVLEVRG